MVPLTEVGTSMEVSLVIFSKPRLVDVRSIVPLIVEVVVFRSEEAATLEVGFVRAVALLILGLDGLGRDVRLKAVIVELALEAVVLTPIRGIEVVIPLAVKFVRELCGPAGIVSVELK